MTSSHLRKGSSRKSGRDSAEKKEPVMPCSDRPIRERKVVERYSVPSVAWSSSSKTLSIVKGRTTQIIDIPNGMRLVLSFQQEKQKAKILSSRERKNANMVGILVGTLGVAGHLHMIRQMKELIMLAGKKAYTLVIGRPNPTKLANFPEVTY
ncbi:hypothetical protein GOBAR_DD04059 [Gossypium barbadense]|nr:hypothetical protein GOBAR_DD04059 [Gossypium barbadense]